MSRPLTVCNPVCSVKSPHNCLRVGTTAFGGRNGIHTQRVRVSLRIHPYNVSMRAKTNHCRVREFRLTGALFHDLITHIKVTEVIHGGS